MEINVAIGGGQKMTLTRAILVYQGGVCIQNQISGGG